MGDGLSDGAFALPPKHKNFKEYVGHKTDLSRAVIPAAILAGYTGEISYGADEVNEFHIYRHRGMRTEGDCLLSCFIRKRSDSAVAVSAGASDRPQLSIMYKLDRGWVGVQANGP